MPNFTHILDGQPSRVLLRKVFPHFDKLKFLYFCPRRTLDHKKRQIRWIINNQNDYDVVVIDHSMEPFYVPEPHATERNWHTRNRQLHNELVSAIHKPVIVFHGDPSVNSSIHRYLPTFYFLVRDHPGNYEFCLQHATTHKPSTLSWLNNGLRAQRCHLLTQLWDKKYFNTEKIMYSFYNNQTYTPNSPIDYQKDVQDLSLLDLEWLEKTCSAQTVQSVRNKLNDIWHHLPIEIDQYFAFVERYNLAWLDSIMDISNTSAFSHAHGHIVSETSIFTHRFMTEKTFKPIAMGMPTLVHHHSNTIQYLEEMGFDMYRDIVNQSYDNEHNYEKRTKMLVDSIDRYVLDTPEIPDDRKIQNIHHFYSDELYNQQVTKLINDVEQVLSDK